MSALPFVEPRSVTTRPCASTWRARCVFEIERVSSSIATTAAPCSAAGRRPIWSEFGSVCDGSSPTAGGSAVVGASVPEAGIASGAGAGPAPTGPAPAGCPSCGAGGLTPRGPASVPGADGADGGAEAGGAEGLPADDDGVNAGGFAGFGAPFDGLAASGDVDGADGVEPGELGTEDRPDAESALERMPRLISSLCGSAFGSPFERGDAPEGRMTVSAVGAPLPHQFIAGDGTGDGEFTFTDWGVEPKLAEPGPIVTPCD